MKYLYIKMTKAMKFINKGKYIYCVIALVTLLNSCQDESAVTGDDLYNENTESIVVPADQRTLNIDDMDHFMFFSFEALKYWWSATVQYKIEDLTADQKAELETMYGTDYFSREWYDADIDQDGVADGDQLAETDWFSMSPTDESFGSRPVTMSITRNIEKVPRVVFINFTPIQDNAQAVPFKLIQQAAKPFVEVSDTIFEVPIAYTTYPVSITTSETWKVTTDNPAMFALRDSTAQKDIDFNNNSCEKTRNRLLSLSVKTNTTGDARTGKIIFISLEDGQIRKEITVSQVGENVPPTVNVENTPDVFKVKWNAVFGQKGYLVNFYKVTNGVTTNTVVGSYKFALNKKTEKNTEFEIDVPLLITDWSLDNGNFYAGQVEPRVSVLYYLGDDSESTESLPNSSNIVNNLFDSSSGDGMTESNAFVIKSLRHLQNLNVVASANAGFRYYRLDADIDLNGVAFVPIGSAVSPRKQCAGTSTAQRVQETGGPIYRCPGATGGFVGNFNGNGRKISNYSNSLLVPTFNGSGCPATVALFSTVSENSVIRNLTVSGFSFTLDDNGGSTSSGLPPSLEYYDYLLVHAPLVAILRGNAIVDNCTAENCNIKYVKVMAGSRYEKNYIGGLVGFALDESQIKNSTTTNGYIFTTDKSASGGILGGAGHPTVSISKCTNKMQYIAATGSIVGGILGRGGCIVENCANYSVVRPSLFMGGIMGNSSVVSGTNASGGHTSVVNTMQATLCVNYGKFGVTGTGTDKVDNFTSNNEAGGNISNGGLIGYSDKAVLKQCANYGDLDNHIYAGTGTAKWGGLIGESRNGTKLTDCANYGNIRFSLDNNAIYSVGGLYGIFYASSSSTEVNNVFNAGTITLVSKTNGTTPQMGNYTGELNSTSGFKSSNVYILGNTGLNLCGTDAGWTNAQVFTKSMDELKMASTYTGWTNWNVVNGQLPVIKNLPGQAN